MYPNRRTFLLSTGLTAVSASRVLGANDTISVGAIGCGGRMRELLNAVDRAEGVRLVAGSDVYEPRRDAIRERTGGTASTHLDYREILDSKEVDAVIIAVPDHSHVRVALDAIAAGKDVYLEKPVTHALEEGDRLIRGVRSSKQILQSGMQQRSWVHFQSAVDLIQAANIGRLTQVRTYWFQNYQNQKRGEPIRTELLDWKRWLGSAREQPFTEEKFRRWRWFWDFGGGAMTDLFTHWIDVVHWATKTSEPRLAQVLGDRYVFEQLDCPDTVLGAFRYPNFEVVYEGTMISSIDDGGLEFRGTEGTIKLNRSGFSVHREGAAKENPVLSERSIEDGTITHMKNFLACVRDRKEPNAPVETGVAAAAAGHIANLALRKAEKVIWPPLSASSSR